MPREVIPELWGALVAAALLVYGGERLARQQRWRNRAETISTWTICIGGLLVASAILLHLCRSL